MEESQLKKRKEMLIKRHNLSNAKRLINVLRSFTKDEKIIKKLSIAENTLNASSLVIKLTKGFNKINNEEGD